MDKSKIYTNPKDEWYTPKEVFDYGAKILGGGEILDPATTPSQAKRLGVKKYYTKEIDGLSQKWENEKIWINPPFSNKEEFIKKAREAVNKFNCKIVMLLPASLETKVFRKYILNYATLHIPNKRISFFNEEGIKPNGSAFTTILVELTPYKNNEYRTFEVEGT